MKALAMAGIMAAAAVVALPSESRADWRIGVVIGQNRDWYGARGDWRGTGPAYRYGYDRGWRDGSREGQRDGRRSRDPRFWRDGDFRDGDSGYKRWMGPRPDYTSGYREGYSQGYRRAYGATRPDWRDRGYDRDRYRDDRDRYRGDRNRRDWDR